MRVLILSDIHANVHALEAVLERAPQHDTVWNLGDIVGYGANPNEVIDRVHDLGETFVRGNHDRACSGLEGIETFNPVAARAARWTQCVLSAPHIAWLRHLPRGPVQPVPVVENVTCAHGSLVDEDEYILSAREAWRSLSRGSAPVNFFGHTHIQGGYATDGDQWFRLTPTYYTHDEAENWELQLSSGASYLLNPGSVGQPRDGDWRAAFAVYNSERSTLLFCRVPYDIAGAQRNIERAGLPHRLAARLRDGR